MNRLVLVIFFSLMIKSVFATSPHGEKLEMNCSICHNSDNWSIIERDSFNHDVTHFPLIGKHKIVDCKKCHSDLEFSNVKSQCAACHADVHQNKAGQDCERCHNQENWKTMIFDHKKTVFPLTGRHSKLECLKCHADGYANISTACVDCHIKDYNSVTDPNHVESNFSKDCFTCHNTDSWSNTSFNHNKSTIFQLKGKHIGLSCKSCHEKGFKNTSSLCVNCHLKDYTATQKLNHEVAKISKECGTCHTESAWKPSTFNHNSGTSFPLNGAHMKADCTNCHSSNFASTSTTCVDCHIKDYLAAKNPNHVAADFSKDCQNCHNTTSRSPAKFDHNKFTSFPITGGHTGVECKSCHSTGYRGRSTACISCHQKNYDSTIYPNHNVAKFSKECLNCHTIKSWKPSTFNHSTSTSFSLVGGHKDIKCTKCHTNIFSGTSTDCYSCHESNYKSTTQPNHATMKISTHCESCHNITAWKSTNFKHDTQHFPIFSQKHKGVWNTCVECHTNMSNFAQFSCIKCHQHADKTAVDRIHIKVNDYEYTNSSCYSCHPKGKKLKS